MRTLVVRDGQDARLPVDEKTRRSMHVREVVYSEMFLQVCLDFSGLPDPRTLSPREVRFYFNGLRSSLREQTKPRG